MANSFPRSHRFRGIPYKLYWRKPRAVKEEESGKEKAAVGRCFPLGHPAGPALYIQDTRNDPEAEPLDFFDSILHEGLHACLPDLDEAAVTETTDSIWTLLKRMKAKITFGE